MKINSVVVIDDNVDSRINFGVALEEIKADIDYYPFEHIDEALTIPNALISHAPDIIFINLDAPFSHGLQCILRLKKVNQYENVPVVAYSNFEIERWSVETTGAYYYFQMHKSVSVLLKVLSAIIGGAIAEVGGL